MKKESAQFDEGLEKYLKLYEKEQRLRLMKEAISKNLPLVSRQKDSVPADYEEESVNRTVVRRGFTTRMLNAVKLP